MEALETKKDRMVQVLDRWRWSGLSKRKFCESEGLSLQVLVYWIAKLKPESIGQTGFVSLERSISSKGIEISFPSGAILRMEGEVSALWLRELVEVAVNKKG